jgi:hypothetical protein
MGGQAVRPFKFYRDTRKGLKSLGIPRAKFQASGRSFAFEFLTPPPQ